jgi:hypothetical protein
MYKVVCGRKPPADTDAILAEQQLERRSGAALDSIALGGKKTAKPN